MSLSRSVACLVMILTVTTTACAAVSLKTVGVQADDELESNILRTAGPVAGLRLMPDRTEIAADGQDLSFISVESVDEHGNFQPNGNQLVTFAIDGPPRSRASPAAITANFGVTRETRWQAARPSAH